MLFFVSFQMNHLVTPVVGFIEDTFQATPNPAEVSDVFVMPLEYFVQPINYKALPYENSSGYLCWMHCFTYYDHEHNRPFKIWGLTAHFALFLALIIFGKRPTFEVDYDLDNLFSSSENNFMNLYASLYKRKKSNLWRTGLAINLYWGREKFFVYSLCIYYDWISHLNFFWIRNLLKLFLYNILKLTMPT